MRRGTAAILWLAAVVSMAGAEPGIGFDELYETGVLGLAFSETVTSNRGKRVSIAGYMAPPLRAEGNFFVLTKIPVSLCPYCNSDADWPKDIIVVYLKKEEIFVQRSKGLVVTGRLELGSRTDAETGFVSLLRLVDASYREE